MMKLTCAVVEDDSVSRAFIKGLIEKTNILSLEGSFSSAQEALPWLNENEVDLLFLDVEMPGISGLEMFRSLPYKPDVIIISGNPQYAVEAFDLSLADYLVKPLKDYSRFLAAVNKVVIKKAKLKLNDPGISSSDGTLFVKVDSLLLKIDIETILWVEAFGDYVKIQTTEKLHTVYSTLKKVEDKLDPKKFVRVHRSYIINIAKISNINPHNLEINKKIIPISGTYKEDLLNRIKIL
jgi:DNA-binding LytR/AlgR family response regulator